MANPRIEVEIGAVIDGLQQGFGQAVKIIDTLEKQAQDLEKALRDATDLETIQKLNVDLAKTRSALSQLRTTGIDPLTKATKDYNAVGVNFARLIQDAPFGIIGVSNNITSLAESFGDAKSKGQTFTQALKGIFSSGNLLTLGISVLTSAFVVLQQKGFFKTEESAKSLSDALEEYREKLDAIKKASLEGQGNAQRDIQNFKLLKTQAENANIPFQRRVEAVKELQKTYPNYLGNLTQDQILTGKVGDAYKNLTNELVATAKARAFSNQIAENALSIFTLEQQQVDNVAKLINLREQETRLSALANLQAKKSRGEFTGLDIQLLDIQKQIRDIQLEQVKAVEDANKLKTENLNLETKINEQVIQGAVFTKSQVDSAKELKRIFEEIQNIQTNRPAPSFDLSQPILPGIQQQVDDLTSLEEKLKGTGLTIGQFYRSIASGAAEGFDSLERFIQRLSDTQQFINNAFATLEQGLEGTIGDIAFAVGDALATGADVTKAAGAALLGGLAGILNQLGQLAIATGVAIGGIREALKTLNPVVAIAGGVALVALAGFVSAKARSLAGAGGGGRSLGASGVGAGTTFTGGGQGFNFNPNSVVVLETVVRGEDILFVSQQASNRINKG